MSEFDDIFAYDLTTIVFTWTSIIMLIVLAPAALWPRSSHEAMTQPADRWLLWKNSSSNSAMRS